MTYKELVKRFTDIYGTSIEDIRIFEAPGRINLIGEHIDYNGGNVFPAALVLKNIVVARKNGSDNINMAVTSLPNRVSADISKLDSYKQLEWGNYQLGVAYVLEGEGYEITGCDLLYHGTVPYGSGLSSSAAIEVATALALLSLGDNVRPSLADVAVMCQRAEREYVGMNCGIMDQFISALGKKDNAIYLNCNTLEYEYVPLNLGDYTIVITNTNSPHKLTDSQYNERRSQCEKALDVINASGGKYEYLCDMTLSQLKIYKQKFTDKILYKRARHCVAEQERTRRAVALLKEGNLKGFGDLLCGSNISLRDDYEATGEELDAVFDIAMSIDGVLGSRMTGGGFGGCNISIVKKDSVPEFKKTMSDKYKNRIGYAPSFYESSAGCGGREVFDWQ